MKRQKITIVRVVFLFEIKQSLNEVMNDIALRQLLTLQICCWLLIFITYTHSFFDVKFFYSKIN
ncbi:hypothetical protein [Spiroplasma endosymbiont of Polydrusus formosus]|uniref:hypothetical protein n=1 Tax=Spiroplasma endosymbiont of Polydrusus formosus TaxID=3139326 RepID=UPI0035B55EFE